MANFVQTARQNLKQDPIPTIATTLGILVAMVLMYILIGVSTGTRLISLLAAIPVTIFLATRVRQLGWYFGINLGDNGATYLEAQAIDVLPFTLVPRATPKGTKLLELSDDKAVFTVKAIIYFWNWFLPFNFVTLAFISAPIAAAYSYVSDETALSLGSRLMMEKMLTDAGASFGVFLCLAVVSYFLTRPNVRVVVKPDTIKFGSYLFDRRYVTGLGEDISNPKVETRPSFGVPKSGSTKLYMRYGAWGERMKYQVSTESAVEIIFWANNIIKKVGMAQETTPKASAGQKTELL